LIKKLESEVELNDQLIQKLKDQK
jgi:chromosome segregation ATPase